jgi:hypothetical protein
VTDLLHPQKGARPWLPADDVRAGEELARYDIPLVGLIEQGDATFVYSCLIGEVESVNLWAYAHLDSSEVAALRSASEADFDGVVEQVLSNRPLVVAIASNLQLEDWDKIDVGANGPLVAAREFLDHMHRKWSELQARAAELERHRELAGQ